MKYFLTSCSVAVAAAAASLFAATLPTPYFSDAFSRTNLTPCALGPSDDFRGGTPHFYLPIFPEGGTNASKPVGAIISSNSLANAGLDFGGVQFTSTSDPCNGGRGIDMGQDLFMSMSVLVPASQPGVSYAGPYFRSRLAASGDGIIGGTSAGFWVELLNTGDIHVVQLNPFQIIATARPVETFDPSIFHSLEIDVQGNVLFVGLDGKLMSFRDAQGLGGCDSPVILPNAGVGDQGAAGIAFGTNNRGQAGGQRVDDLFVSPYSGTVALLQSDAGSARVIATNTTLLIQGSNANGSQTVEACGFLNYGTIRLTTIDSTWTAGLIADSGYLTNANSGLIDILPGAGGSRFISGDIDNSGSFHIFQDLSLTRPSGLFNNSGTVELGTNITLQFENQGGEILDQNAGMFSIDSGGKILGFHGQFNQDGGILNVSSNVGLSGLFFTYNGGQITGAPDFFDTDLRLNSTASNAALFTMLGSNRLLSDVPQNQTISVLGANRGASSLLISTNGFANRGVLRLETADSTWDSSLVVNNGVLTNATSGIIDVEKGTEGTRSITAHLLNQGAIQIRQTLQINQPLDNQGTIDLAPGIILNFENHGQQIFNQNTGSLTLNGNSKIGGFNGQFNMNGGVLTVSSNVALTSLFFTYNGGQINGLPDFYDTDLRLNPAAPNAAVFTLLGSNRLLSDLTPNQTISVLGANRGASALLISSNGFANRGMLRLETVDSTWDSSLIVKSGTLTNTSSGVIDIEKGSEGTRSITAPLLNQGAMQIRQTLQISQPLTNQGTIDLALGIILNFETHGQQIFDQNAGSLTLNGNSKIGGFKGQFNMNAGLLNVSSNVSLTGLFFTYNGGQINGNADFYDTDLRLNPSATNAALFTLLGANRLLSDVTQNQTISVLGANRGASSLLISSNGFANRGVLRLETMDSTWDSSLIVNTGTLTNTSAGLIDIEKGSEGTRSITASLLNQGAIQIRQTLQISQPLNNQGTIDLAPGIILNFENHGQQVFNQSAGALTLNGNSAIIGFHGQFNMNGGAVNVSSNVALTSLFFTYNGGQINGAADFSDTDLRFGPAVSNPASFTLLGSNRLLSDVPAKQTISMLGANRGASSTLISTNGFSNHGLLKMETVDSTWASTLIVNSGAITNELDGTIQINPGTGGTRDIDAVVSNLGTITVNDDITLDRANAVHNNRGTINVFANSTLKVNGQLTQGDGKIALAGGAIQSATPLMLAGGVVTGNGRLASDVQNNGGDISAAGGNLAISGALTQKSSGSITLRTKGAPSLGTDLLAVDGPVNLAGTLNIQPPADYTPRAGDRFVLLTGQSISGTFGTVVAPPTTNQTVWQPAYLPASVEVRIVYATNAVVFTDPTRLANGEIEFSFHGVANTHYSIEASQDLMNWIVLTNFVQPTAPFPFVDPASTNLLHRFYRARAQ